MATKNCYHCLQDKPVSEFNKSGMKKDGLHSYCKPCTRKIQKQRRLRMRKPCSVTGCVNIGYVEKGMCPMHYERWKKNGDPGPPGKLPKKQPCKLEGCLRLRKARGWCALHYRRVIRTGSPGSVLPKIPRKRCLVPRCERKHRARGLCEMHWHRWQRTGKIGPTNLLINRITKCTHKFCDAKHYCKGLCKRHYRVMSYQRMKAQKEAA